MKNTTRSIPDIPNTGCKFSWVRVTVILTSNELVKRERVERAEDSTIKQLDSDQVCECTVIN